MDMLGPDPKTVARQSAADARRAAEEQYAKDTLAATGLGGGIVSSQMLLDQMNGDDAELTAQRAAADREWTYGHIVVDEAQELTAMAPPARSPSWAMWRRPRRWVAPDAGANR